VPASVPKPFDEIARECLHVDPARRCTLSDVRLRLEGKSKQVPAPPLSVSEPHVPTEMSEKPSRARLPLVPLIIGFVLLAAIIAGLSMRSHKTQTAPLQTETIKQAPPAEPESTAPAPPPAARGTAKGEVLNRVMPDVSRQASNTIHGTVTVVVRETVDPSGAVTDAQLASHGPSAYFARIAMESARNWKFKAPVQNGQAVASTWLLHYKFRRGGVDVTPVEQ
jgi:TonB family protein